jgi:hypothetical protein
MVGYDSHHKGYIQLLDFLLMTLVHSLLFLMLKYEHRHRYFIDLLYSFVKIALDSSNAFAIPYFEIKYVKPRNSTTSTPC